MRKEDRRRWPPLLRLRLPKGFYAQRHPGGYSLELAYCWGRGTGHDLVQVWGPEGTPQEIEAKAREMEAQLKSPPGWRGIHQHGSPGQPA